MQPTPAPQKRDTRAGGTRCHKRERWNGICGGLGSNKWPACIPRSTHRLWKGGKEGEVAMQELVVEIMNRFGYTGIGGLILIETIFPPIPSEVILTFGGFLTTCTKLTAPGVIASSTLASVLGAFLLYAFGRLLAPARMQKLFASRVGSRLGFQAEELEQAVQSFEQKGEGAVFFGRCVPIVRSLISIPAGMVGMNLPRFAIYTAAGSLIWDTLLVLLGAAAGRSWEIITQYMDAYAALVRIAGATLAVTFLLRLIKKKRSK